ncbi:hypothetical protein N7517_010541 [Penicillium concentricum]|uniref:Uncharacterized protein n=1 Tax=Penicillium concentricum TaxID=293559 RepID=A0A9W9USP9_9EURO|nr:uncharacterized protein N7517_010541 [Penicillium concentricum]KAJ5355932.1 hypothetical protein N7517_010541 [Penicillium concentricum]
MSSETGPSSSVHPTDNKGKRKRPESPSEDPTSRKVYFPNEFETMSLTQDSIVQGYESSAKAVSQDQSNQGTTKETSSQYPQVPVEPHGAFRRVKAPWPTGESAANHPDRTFDDLDNFRKFLRDSRDEAELAVYLGLQHKHDLRNFALSWPVIKTWIKAPHKQTISLKVEISHLIQDGKELSCIVDPYEIWPQRPQESEEHASLRSTHIMSSDLHNFHRTRRYRGELSAMLELDIPLDNVCHPRPQLISWKNEPNDKFDRCWTILGYVSLIPYMKSWEKALGFFVSSSNKAIIYDSNMPTGTIPRPNHLVIAQQCSSVSLEESANDLAPIQVKVTWDRNRNTLRNMNLCRVLTGIAHNGKVLPPTDPMMTQDPRLCRTGASFRDVIRHMMSCGGYGLNLYDLTMSYRVETDNSYYQMDALRTQWKVVHGIFSHSANTNFVIRVLLDVHDYRNGEVYETTELPPVY